MGERRLGYTGSSKAVPLASSSEGRRLEDDDEEDDDILTLFSNSDTSFPRSSFKKVFFVIRSVSWKSSTICKHRTSVHSFYKLEVRQGDYT